MLSEYEGGREYFTRHLGVEYGAVWCWICLHIKCSPSFYPLDKLWLDSVRLDS